MLDFKFTFVLTTKLPTEFIQDRLWEGFEHQTEQFILRLFSTVTKGIVKQLLENSFGSHRILNFSTCTFRGKMSNVACLNHSFHLPISFSVSDALLSRLLQTQPLHWVQNAVSITRSLVSHSCKHFFCETQQKIASLPGPTGAQVRWHS